MFITGSPGTGKSTFALNLIESELINNSSSATLIFSLERSPKELLDLMVRSVSEITGWKFDPKTLFGTKIARFKEARNSLKTSLCSYATVHTQLKIYVTARTINNIILKQSDKKRLSVILIDYLENIEPSCKSLERIYQVREALVSLKALSEELEVSIILLARLDRKIFTNQKSIT